MWLKYQCLLFDDILQEPEYRLLADLNGSKGPVNALAFSRDGSLLASGGTQCHDMNSNV